MSACLCSLIKLEIKMEAPDVRLGLDSSNGETFGDKSHPSFTDSSGMGDTADIIPALSLADLSEDCIKEAEEIKERANTFFKSNKIVRYFLFFSLVLFLSLML